jgi:hypothetical protein
MSTSETYEHVVQACPCGAGSIIKTVVSYDKPWSGADISYRLDCVKCQPDWDLPSGGGFITLRASILPSKKANDAAHQAHIALDNYLRELAGEHFAEQALRTKKAEHAYLAHLSLFKGPYRSYLKARKARSIENLAYFSKNTQFVSELVAKFGDNKKYLALRTAVAKCQAASAEAAAKIVRHRVGS